MKIQYYNAPVFLNGSMWLDGDTRTSPSGQPWVLKPNGKALSTQPNGSQQDRDVADPNTYEPGPYEVHAPDATVNVLHVNPGVPFSVAYRGV